MNVELQLAEFENFQFQGESLDEQVSLEFDRCLLNGGVIQYLDFHREVLEVRKSEFTPIIIHA